MLYDHKSLTYP